MLDRTQQKPNYQDRHANIACPQVCRSYALVKPSAKEGLEYDLAENAAWHYWEKRRERLEFKPLDYVHNQP
eukprot:5482008-Prorocentrum_lima.AAC.1